MVGYCVAISALGLFVSLSGHLALLAVAVAALVLAYAMSFHAEPLLPTSTQAVAAARPYAYAVVASFILLVGIAAYLR
jgi:hypothetical protein